MMSDNIEVKLVEGEFKRLVVDDNDIIVVTVKDLGGRLIREQLHRRVSELFPKSKVVILDANIDLSIFKEGLVK